LIIVIFNRICADCNGYLYLILHRVLLNSFHWFCGSSI